MIDWKDNTIILCNKNSQEAYFYGLRKKNTFCLNLFYESKLAIVSRMF